MQNDYKIYDNGRYDIISITAQQDTKTTNTSSTTDDTPNAIKATKKTIGNKHVVLFSYFFWFQFCKSVDIF